MEKYVYIGTSQRHGGAKSGMFRRPVNSDNWEVCPLPNGENISVYHIELHPKDTSVMLASTSEGLYRTTDGAKSWTRLMVPENEQAWSALIHPADPNVIFVGTGPVGVHRSDDNGKTWRRLPQPQIPDLLKGEFFTRIMRMAATADRPNTVWACIEGNGAIRSDDRGETWVDLNPNLVENAKRPHLESAIITKDTIEGMLDVHSMCVSPAAPDTPFIALRMGLWRGEDSGRVWTDLGIGRYEPTMIYGRDIVVAPWNPKVLFACISTDSRGDIGRVYKSEDLGLTWRQFDHDVTVKSTIRQVGLDRTDPDSVHCVTREGQTFSTLDGGKNWREIATPANTSWPVAIAVA